MDLTTLLHTLSTRGVVLRVQGEALGVEPRGAVAGLEDAIRQHKPALLELLARSGGRLEPEELRRCAGGWGAPTRDPDPWGCPMHWHGVPELPPKGARVRLMDGSGYGALYRVKVAERWYLLKFLPPFDGRLSLTDTQGRTRVLASLEEAAALLGVLPEAKGG